MVTCPLDVILAIATRPYLPALSLLRIVPQGWRSGKGAPT